MAIPALSNAMLPVPPPQAVGLLHHQQEVRRVWGAQVWFLGFGAVLLMAATFIGAKDRYSLYSRKLLLFGAYVYLITALILVFIDAFFLDAAIWDFY